MTTTSPAIRPLQMAGSLMYGAIVSNLGRWAHWYDRNDEPRFYGGEDTTYHAAEQHLAGLDIEDWGCGFGWFRSIHDGGYVGIDGTPGYCDIVADLVDYRSQTPGLLLRHVLEHDYQWEQILANAAASATDVLVIVVFTPMAETCKQIGYTDTLDVPDLTIPHQALLDVCPEWTAYTTDSQYETERIYIRR